MEIASFQILNFKSYKDSGELRFSTGFNILVGQNNVGKSALLEALGLKFPSKPHKSLSVLPRAITPLNPVSSGKVVLSVTGEELKEMLLRLTPVDQFRQG